MTKKERIGETSYNFQGLKMEIIEYFNIYDITVKFENGFVAKHRRYREFIKGNIKNLLHPTVCNIGYIGVGEYKSSYNGKSTIAYIKWREMIRRCYDEQELIEHPTYEPCIVCEEWYNFQNFAKWFYENYYTIPGEKMHLDKDILFKGNKLYSPKTCCIVPQQINYLFLKSDATRGKYLIGVHFEKDTNKYVAECRRMNTRNKRIGRFNTELEAFYKYKEVKEQEIKDVANFYKDYIPEKVYNAMMHYEVEMTD